MSSNKQIAKNTIILYARMIVTMLVTLYTSRIVLNSLGVSDYGIYNVVGSFIAAFTFISGPLSTATQRFLNFEIGKGNSNNINTIFNLSLFIYVILALLMAIVIAIGGEIYIRTQMQFPAERLDAAIFALYFSIIALIFNLLKTPFESLVIAEERFSFFAVTCIIEVALKLANALSLSMFYADKLKLFSINQSIIIAIIGVAFSVYSLYYIRVVKVQSIHKIWDRNKFKELISFSGWSLFGAAANMSANQGISLLLNYYFGVIINAAAGIGHQISSAINQFAYNFQVAFRPQLVKDYASEKFDDLRNLIISSSKFSYILLLAIVCPVCFNIEWILKVWLVNPPHSADILSVFLLIDVLIETLSAPLWMTIQATGNIRKYQIIISSAIFSTILISLFALWLGAKPYTVFLIKCLIDILCLSIRLSFVKRAIEISIKEYIHKVLMPVGYITVLSICLEHFLVKYLHDSFIYVAISSSIFIVTYLVFAFLLCTNRNEKQIILNVIKSKLRTTRQWRMR